jgi:hypothetical protein
MIETKDLQSAYALRMTRFPEGTVFELFVTAASQGKIETRRLAAAELVTVPPVPRAAIR